MGLCYRSCSAAGAARDLAGHFKARAHQPGPIQSHGVPSGSFFNQRSPPVPPASQQKYAAVRGPAVERLHRGCTLAWQVALQLHRQRTGSIGPHSASGAGGPVRAPGGPPRRRRRGGSDTARAWRCAQRPPRRPVTGPSESPWPRPARAAPWRGWMNDGSIQSDSGPRPIGFNSSKAGGAPASPGTTVQSAGQPELPVRVHHFPFLTLKPRLYVLVRLSVLNSICGSDARSLIDALEPSVRIFESLHH